MQKQHVLTVVMYSPPRDLTLQGRLVRILESHLPGPSCASVLNLCDEDDEGLHACGNEAGEVRSS
ncbi:hypothetical protein MWU61_13555 [Loktanella sp. F6476L]|uniref:hypothetical protein n=1 Tax=Loktanella sp. F6476L TaxID=2926405 RepID=UPI001FF58CFE|nr:hypothetical protein [Loktanella sp. F6476L]MCK0121572.1 hypothetical protein [Loktanella sp. F6476L]